MATHQSRDGRNESDKVGNIRKKLAPSGRLGGGRRDKTAFYVCFKQDVDSGDVVR